MFSSHKNVDLSVNYWLLISVNCESQSTVDLNQSSISVNFKSQQIVILSQLLNSRDCQSQALFILVICWSLSIVDLRQFNCWYLLIVNFSQLLVLVSVKWNTEMRTVKILEIPLQHKIIRNINENIGTSSND